MSAVRKIALIVMTLSVISVAGLAQAQVRDAGSKIRGESNLFDRSAGSYTAAANPMMAPAVAAPATSSSAARSFSVAPRRNVNPPVATRPNTSVARRFSYQPMMPSTSRPYAAGRSWGQGYHDAGAKIRGEL